MRGNGKRSPHGAKRNADATSHPLYRTYLRERSFNCGDFFSWPLGRAFPGFLITGENGSIVFHFLCAALGPGVFAFSWLWAKTAVGETEPMNPKLTRIEAAIKVRFTGDMTIPFPTKQLGTLTLCT
jgi:hypothetical protein